VRILIFIFVSNEESVHDYVEPMCLLLPLLHLHAFHLNPTLVNLQFHIIPCRPSFLLCPGSWLTTTVFGSSVVSYS
jgi:hypothetical protein